MVEASIQWNYTTVLNIVFLVLAAVLCYRFIRTGGIAMLKMMGGEPDPRRPSRSSRARRAVTPKLTGPACRTQPSAC